MKLSRTFNYITLLKYYELILDSMIAKDTETINS